MHGYYFNPFTLRWWDDLISSFYLSTFILNLFGKTFTKLNFWGWKNYIGLKTGGECWSHNVFSSCYFKETSTATSAIATTSPSQSEDQDVELTDVSNDAPASTEESSAETPQAANDVVEVPLEAGSVVVDVEIQLPSAAVAP